MMIAMLALVVTCVSVLGGRSDRAVDQALAELALQRKGSVLVLKGEIEFSRRMARLRQVRTDMVRALRKQDEFNRQEQDNWSLKERLINERQQLNGRLATTRTPRQHNKLVARINQITDQLQLIEMATQDPRRRDADDVVRVARKRYMAEVESLRSLAAEVREEYEQLELDDRLQDIVVTLNGSGAREYVLGPRKKFEKDLALLETFGHAVVSQAIPMDSRMNSHWVEVVFNGKFTQEMIFDTGADFVCLTSAMAARMGIVPDNNSPIFIVGMASGGTVETRAVFVRSVSVGGFEAKNVTCVIWPPEMATAPPLLGGSYLRHFIYQIDPAADSLTLTRINPTP